MPYSEFLRTIKPELGLNYAYFNLFAWDLRLETSVTGMKK